MAISIIKSSKDLHALLDENAGITGKVYDNLRDLATAGEQKMYKEQQGELGVFKELEEITKEINRHGQTCAIDYDKSKNKFTIIMVDKENASIADIEKARKNYNKKGGTDYSEATFDIVDASGMNYGRKANQPMVLYDAKASGGAGRAIMVPRAAAEIRETRIRIQKAYATNKHKTIGLKKGILESAKSGAYTKLNEVFNDKSTGALSEYNGETTVSGIGKEFAVENFAKSRQVVVTQLLKTLKYINNVDDYYDNLMWLMTARIAQAKDREKEIELLKKDPAFAHLVAYKGFDSMAHKVKDWATTYHAENIDWREVNENSVATGILGGFSSATNVARSGNRAREARNQSKQQLLHRAVKRSVFNQSIYRSSEAEAKAGIDRGRAVKRGEYVPFDAFVMGLEVNPLDERVAKTHTLADNIGVSGKLLRQVAGERNATIVINKKDADERLNAIYNKLLKNKKRRYSDADGYITHTGKRAEGELFRDLVGDAKSFKDLPPELQKIVLTEAWRQGIAKRGRDIKPSDELANNIRVETTEAGTYIIRGTELIRPKQGDKLLGQGANIKGSAEIMDDSLKQFGSQYQFLVAQKKGDVRKFGANYVDPDLNALLIEYGSSIGLHNGKGGLKKLEGFLENIVKNVDGKELSGTVNAAKAILDSYGFTDDGGVIVKKAVMDSLQELKPEEQTEALKELLPLIDRLINGLDKNNNLMSREAFEATAAESRYYKRGVDDAGNEVLLRTNKEKRVFANVHRANELEWKGANMYAGRESLRRSAGLAASEKGATQDEIKALQEGVGELYKRIDVSEEKKSEFDRLKTDAEEAINLTNKSQGGIKSGLQDNGDYVVLITKNADPSDDSLIDIGNIASAEYEDGVLVNPDDILQGVMQKKLGELASKGIDISKVHFGIDTGTSFGGVVGNKTYGGQVYFMPQKATLDNEKDFESYGVEAQKLVNLLNSVVDIEPEIIAQKATDLMETTLQDFQNKGSVYERYFGGKTEGVMAGKVLPMATQWIMNGLLTGDAAKNLTKLERWQGDMATSGAFISKSMFDKSTKKATKQELLELYEDFYGGVDGLYDPNIKRAKKDGIKKAIEKAITYSEDNSVFMQLLEAGKLESGLRSFVSRFPFSNGLDVKNVRKVFIDSRLNMDGAKSNAMRLGLGLANSFNADFDGDVAEMLLGTRFTKTEKAAAEVIGRSEEAISKKLAYFAYKDMVEDAGYKLNDQNQYVAKDGVTALDEKTLENIFDQNLHLVAATGVRYGKQNTGKLSNLATEFRNMLNVKGFDESALLNADTDEARSAAANAMIGRAFLEQMEQDAISSKKNIERMIKVKTGKDASTMSDDERYEAYVTAIEDVDSILENFYTKKLDFSWLTKKLSDVGVLESEGELKSGRVLRQALEHIQRMKGGEDIIAQIFGVDKSQIDFEDKNAKNYYLNRSISSSQMGAIFSNIADTVGAGSVNNLFNALPNKEFSPEKRTIKPWNLATEDVKKADKAWLDHINSLNAAEEASISEANAESNKIGIAFKEAEAIKHLSNSYALLSEKLEETQGDYKALDRLSTSELKNRLLPYAGEQTTGLDNRALNDIYAGIQKGETFSKKELVEKFGVKDEKALDSLFLSNLSTLRGDYIHNIAQGNKEKAVELEDKIRKLFEVFGFTTEEITKTFENYTKSAQNVREIAGSFGKSLGAEIPLIGMTNGGQYVINGRTDEVFVGERTNKFDDSKKDRVMTLVDYKSHEGGLLADSDIIQGVAYKSFVEDMKTYLKTEGIGLSFEEAANKIRNDVDWGNKWTPDRNKREEWLSKITPEFLKELKETDVIEVSIIVTDPKTTEAQAYLVGSEKDKYNQIRNRVLSGNTSALTPEERVALRSNAQKMTDADHFRRGVNTTEAGGIENKIRQESKETDVEKENRLKEYLKLLDQQYEIQLRINKLKHEEFILTEQGADLTDVKGKLADERSLKRRVDRAMKDIEKEGFDEAAQKKISQKKSIKDAELKYKSGRFGSTATGRGQDITTEDQIGAESDYEKSLNKILSTYKKIIAAKHQADTTTGQERQAAENLVVVLQKQLGIDKQHIQNLKHSGLLRENQVEEIEKQFALDMATAEAQEKTKRGGASNLFDIIKNDVRRATMRITDFGLAAKALNSIPQSIQRVKQLTGQLEEALMNLRVVAELNREEGEALILTYAKMGKELGASTTEVAASGNEWLN